MTVTRRVTRLVQAPPRKPIAASSALLSCYPGNKAFYHTAGGTQQELDLSVRAYHAAQEAEALRCRDLLFDEYKRERRTKVSVYIYLYNS